MIYNKKLIIRIKNNIKFLKSEIEYWEKKLDYVNHNNKEK